jgi:dipeptidyl aminopeptidase/acylaminoacyl peptidase
MRLEAKNPGDVSAMQPDEPAWFADGDLRVRACVTARDDGGYDLLVRDPDEERWRTLLTWEFEDSRNSRPLYLHPSGRFIYLIDSRGSDTGRVVEADLHSGDVSVLAEDPAYDAADVLFDPDTGTPLAVAFNRARREWQVLDPSVARDFDVLADATRGDVYVFPASSDHWVVDYLRDDDAGGYVAYDRSTGVVTPLFELRPDLAAYRLATAEPIRFTASDGLTIHGYLTFPPGEPRTKLPMVLFPHGGPWARDIWGFRADVQFLATRGYLVMQVNFRGSTGYGKAFLNAANREWGGKMHRDLIDAVDWAIGEGYADADRVAIFGGSYGGYAALVGATFTPDVFRCIIDLLGWSDLVTALKTLPPYWKLREAQWFRRVGDPYQEPEFLWSRSPLSRIDQITRPILIAHGTNDVRVPKSASDQLVATLEQRGIPHEYMVFEDEGHGFRNPENRLRFHRAVEGFLAEHLGGAVAPRPS